MSWARSSPCHPPPHSTSWRSILILSSHLCLDLPCASISQVSLPKPCMHLSCPPILTTCPTHLILDSIPRILLGEEYRPVSSSLCIFLQSPIDDPLTASLNKLWVNTVCRAAFSVQSTGGMPADWGSVLLRSKTPECSRDNRAHCWQERVISDSKETAVLTNCDATYGVAGLYAICQSRTIGLVSHGYKIQISARDQTACTSFW